MNLLCTAAEDQTREFQHDIAVWRDTNQIIEFLPWERLVPYLHFDPAAGLALIDAIVCAADGDPFAWGPGRDPMLTFQITKALRLAEDVRNLPESCAMRDGRKWRAIPFVIVCSPSSYYFERIPEIREDTHAHILTRILDYPTLLLRQIQDIVDTYQDQVLEGYRKVGIIIRFEHGRARIGPALRRKHPNLETEYYYPRADRRDNTGWVTVKRDSDGIRLDVELFQALIDRRVNETEMHKFFEENPAILMEARLGIPISHRPNFAQPKDWKPDFAFSPILGPQREREIELMELKGPAERTLSGTVHLGFSSRVHRAIDQVRDYDRCLRNPANFRAICEAFGYIPDNSRLAVLIGRAPSNEAEKEVFERRRSEIDVKVITYDEILQTQANQIERHLLG
jgi:hypothetical protein